MGSNVSVEGCKARYNETVDCGVYGGNFGGDHFEFDSDIAGIGVLGAFLAITVLSLVLAVFATGWWWHKRVVHPRPKGETDKESNEGAMMSISKFVEVLIISFSDQQVFTGGAYAITLRYVTGCTVSAYHYNVVGNLLLVTCATHLMAVTVSRNYWEHRYMSLLRILVTFLLYLATGLLLANQSSSKFPTEVPPATETGHPLILMPAACFHGPTPATSSGSVDPTPTASVTTITVTAAAAATTSATPRVRATPSLPSGLLDSARVPGWNQFVAMVLFYAVAVLVRIGRQTCRVVARRNDKWKKRITDYSTWNSGKAAAKVVLISYGLFQIVGIVIAAWTVASSGYYIYGLRDWVDGCEWIKNDNPKYDGNPEQDPNSFGQLIPLLLITLTVFIFFQVLTVSLDERNERRKEGEKKKKNTEGEQTKKEEGGAVPPEGASGGTTTTTTTTTEARSATTQGTAV